MADQCFRVWAIRSSWKIVPFIYKSHAVVFNLVVVGGVGSQAHKDDAFAAVQPKVHSPLEIHSNSRAHLHVRDDVSGLELSRQTPSLYEAALVS